MRALAAVGAVLAAGAAALAAQTTGSSHGGDSAPGSRPAAVRSLGHLPGRQQVDFTLVLRLPRAAALRSALDAIDDPHSPAYHHFLAPDAFGRRFGISDAALKRIERWLRARGVAIAASYPQRTALGVRASAASVQRLFGVSLLSFRGANGVRWHAPNRGPAMPHALVTDVSAVTGLDTRPVWRAWDVPGGSLTPSVLQQAYDLAPLRRLGISGRGQSIAVVSFSDYDHSDPDGYAQQFALAGPRPRVISVRRGTTDIFHADEANLDIDVVRAVAPQAQVLVYLASGSASSSADAINQIVAERRSKLISYSWGQCEPMITRAEARADRGALAAARAAGISTFVATGDQGAYDCQGQKASDVRLTVDWPAASSDVIAVGGTRLDLAANGAYRGESAWNDPLSAAGGGGGFSTLAARPRWQVAPGIERARHRRGAAAAARGIPDVSAAADPGTGWTIYWAGGLLDGYGGTSAAAPFWAASTLLVGQYARMHGVRALGDIDPMLYALASTPQRYLPFHDVTFGTNRYFRAAPGWDPATGLGSPDVYALARDVVAYARTHRRARR